jgi:hypothetical protein
MVEQTACSDERQKAVTIKAKSDLKAEAMNTEIKAKSGATSRAAAMRKFQQRQLTVKGRWS